MWGEVLPATGEPHQYKETETRLDDARDFSADLRRFIFAGRIIGKGWQRPSVSTCFWYEERQNFSETRRAPTLARLLAINSTLQRTSALFASTTLLHARVPKYWNRARQLL